MKSSNKKTSNKKPNISLNTIEVDNQNLKFKNEIFQKLFDNNIASRTSKERINSHGNLHFQKKNNYYSPEIKKHYHKIKYKNRNPSNLFNNSKSRKGLKLSNSKKGNNTFSNANSKSTKIIKSNKILRTKNNNNNSNKKLKDYPNLINGVLNQVKYYNLNKNTNYNDNTRYKPVDDFFNEQMQSPIYIGSINDNNTNSPNNSFNLDFKQEQKENNQTNNNDMNDNNITNNIQKVKINDDDNNNEYIDKEIRPRKMIYRKKNIEDGKIKNIKSISPIKTKNIEKTDSDIINEDLYSNNILENYDNNTNKMNRDINSNTDENNKDNMNIIYVKNKKKNEYIPSENINIKFDHTDNRENTIPLTIEENKPKIELILENINYFSIYNNNKNNIFINLELCPNYNFSFNNSNKNENKNSYNYLELINCDMINYIGKKLKNKIKKGPNYDNNGNLIFSNDDELLKYIKKKIIEEKDMIYKNNKIKYNYFILSKQFHGKLLYEIGLENNLNKINEILEKENVEIEHEPIMFVFKKDFNKIKNNENENDNKNKLNEEIIKLNEINKEKEEQLNEMENILNEYQTKLKEYIEVNNILQNEKEKYIKYINELQEYNERIINEYQKIKSQLELEIQKNTNNNKDVHIHENHFNNDLLSIISAEFFNILNNSDTHKDKDIQIQNNNYSNYLNENNSPNGDYLNDNQDDKIISNNIEIISDNDNSYIYKQKININDNEVENIDIKNEKNESLNRALQRIKNMKENQEKNNDDEIKKSEKISEIAQNLEKKLMENNAYKDKDKEYDDEQNKENDYYQSDDNN